MAGCGESDERMDRETHTSQTHTRKERNTESQADSYRVMCTLRTTFVKQTDKMCIYEIYETGRGMRKKGEGRDGLVRL